MDFQNKIEDYLLGKFSTEESKLFRLELDKNPELKKELRKTELAFEAINLDIKEELKTRLITINHHA